MIKWGLRKSFDTPNTDCRYVVASLLTFATIPTCLLGGLLGEYLGRRMTCFMVSPLFLASFLCTALAQVGVQFTVTNVGVTSWRMKAMWHVTPLLYHCVSLQDVYLLYMGRILGGLALGIGSPPACTWRRSLASYFLLRIRIHCVEMS